MKFNITTGGKPVQLANGDFLLVLESHGDDDSYSTSAWSHYNIAANTFNFSKNIQVIAATTLLNACAVVVRKIDPKIQETYKIHDPDAGSIKVSF